MARLHARFLRDCVRPSSIAVMTRFAALIVFVTYVLLGRIAYAQQEPLMGSEAAPLPSQAVAGSPSNLDGDDGVYRILVVGDGLAGGLGNGMARMAETDATIEVLNRFNESSSLARPEVYDWAAAIPKIVENVPIDAIVVLIGVNDRQGIRDGNVRHVFKAPGWESAYTASVDRVLASAKQAGAKVFWISLPPMANAVFDADMRYLSDLHRARVAAAAGHFIDVRPFFVGPDGSFIDRGPDDTGNERKLRESDGIKFMKVGNNRFGQLVLGAVKTLETEATAPAVVAAVAPKPAVEDSITIVAAPPSFGQTGLDGEDLTFRADVVQPLKTPQLSVAQKTASGSQSTDNQKFGVQAFVGSKAQTLFEKGISAPAPAGRFDDFSVPPSP
jgi:uncharacterized protein